MTGVDPYSDVQKFSLYVRNVLKADIQIRVAIGLTSTLRAFIEKESFCTMRALQQLKAIATLTNLILLTRHKDNI